jgi:hypothetical protein
MARPGRKKRANAAVRRRPRLTVTGNASRR